MSVSLIHDGWNKGQNSYPKTARNVLSVYVMGGSRYNIWTIVFPCSESLLGHIVVTKKLILVAWNSLEY